MEILKYKIEKNIDFKFIIIKKCLGLFVINWDSFLKVWIKFCLFVEISFGIWINFEIILGL